MNRVTPEDEMGTKLGWSREDHDKDFMNEPTKQTLLRDLGLRGIYYFPELAAEGAGWESSAEPEPEYFETLPEAIDHQISLAVNETLEQAKPRNRER